MCCTTGYCHKKVLLRCIHWEKCSDNTIVGQSLKGNTHLGTPSQGPDQKGIHSRWHTVSVAFPANVASVKRAQS
jgi:hypothetical protein